MKLSRKIAAGAIAAALTLSGAFSAAAEAQSKTTKAPKKSKSKSAKKDIVETAVAAGSFKTLAAALTSAGLVETLKGAGPFTVLAPTDEAFAALPDGLLEKLLKPENKEALASILKYHVISGNVKAAAVTKLKSAKSVEGSEIAIKVTDGKVTVDAANVTKTDIASSNGVIHVIDAVLVPKSVDVAKLK
jgi:transforming growth factor-beta-induced protein